MTDIDNLSRISAARAAEEFRETYARLRVERPRASLAVIAAEIYKKMKSISRQSSKADSLAKAETDLAMLEKDMRERKAVRQQPAQPEVERNSLRHALNREFYRRGWNRRVSRHAKGFDPEQTRDAHGRWVRTLSEFVETVAAKRPTKAAWIEFHRVDEEEAMRILKATGLDVAGFTHILDADGVRHTLKSHSATGEHNPEHVPVEPADFDKITEVLRNPDAIKRLQTNKKGNATIRFKKTFDDIVFVVEEVRKGRKALAVQTLWKVRSKTKSHPKKPRA